MYLLFARMPGESYCRRFRSVLLLCPFDVVFRWSADFLHLFLFCVCLRNDDNGVSLRTVEVGHSTEEEKERTTETTD